MICRTYQRTNQPNLPHIDRTYPAIARCADRPITTTPASRDGILHVPVQGARDDEQRDVGPTTLTRQICRSRAGSFRLPIWMREGRSQRAIFVPMRAVGEGDDLWRVEVVLWTLEPEAHQVQELLNAVAAATVTSDADDQPVVPDVEQAWSYDSQPPEGGVGVACWVRSDSVGDAAETGWV